MINPKLATQIMSMKPIESKNMLNPKHFAKFTSDSRKRSGAGIAKKLTNKGSTYKIPNIGNVNVPKKTEPVLTKQNSMDKRANDTLRILAGGIPGAALGYGAGSVGSGLAQKLMGQNRLSELLKSILPILGAVGGTHYGSKMFRKESSMPPPDLDMGGMANQVMGGIGDAASQAFSTPVTDPFSIMGQDIPSITAGQAALGLPIAAAFGLPFLGGAGLGLGQTAGRLPGQLLGAGGNALSGLFGLLRGGKK